MIMMTDMNCTSSDFHYSKMRARELSDVGFQAINIKLTVYEGKEKESHQVGEVI